MNATEEFWMSDKAAPAAPVELEPVAYMAESGTFVSAEDVSYTPSWTDYYTTALVLHSDAAAVIAAKDAEIENAQWKHSLLEQQLAAAEARIDALMFEYCPDEMTKEQMDNLAKHQRPVDDAAMKGEEA
jgi:hypothetical protein